MSPQHAIDSNGFACLSEARIQLYPTKHDIPIIAAGKPVTKFIFIRDRTGEFAFARAWSEPSIHGSNGMSREQLKENVDGVSWEIRFSTGTQNQPPEVKSIFTVAPPHMMRFVDMSGSRQRRQRQDRRAVF